MDRASGPQDDHLANLHINMGLCDWEIFGPTLVWSNFPAGPIRLWLNKICAVFLLVSVSQRHTSSNRALHLTLNRSQTPVPIKTGHSPLHTPSIYSLLSVFLPSWSGQPICQPSVCHAMGRKEKQQETNLPCPEGDDVSVVCTVGVEVSIG